MARRVVAKDQSDPTEIEVARDYMRAAKESLEKEQQDLQEIFYAYASWANTQSGARVMKHLRDECQGLSYMPGRDGMLTAFHEGRRSLLLDMEANIANGQRLVALGENADAFTQTQAEFIEEISTI